MHVMLLLALAPMGEGFRGPPAERPMEIVTLPALPEPTVADVIAENEAFEDAVVVETLDLPDGEVDISRIRAMQRTLFPLVTEGLPTFGPEHARAASETDSLTWFTPEEAAGSGLPPLDLSDAELDRIVDGAWSRRDRWRSFTGIATLLSEHDPDIGDAPELMRRHLDRNLLQPYNDKQPPDARFWVLLNLAVDQEPILRFVTRFVDEHPGTRVSTELLFFLDELTEANQGTLSMLVATDPARDLTLTLDRDPDAFALAQAIHDRYVDVLALRELNSPAGIAEYYAGLRIHLLTTIIETTPDRYGAADARYLLGQVYWDQRRRIEALNTWQDIGPDPRGLYAPYYSRIVPEVVAPTAGSAARILGALGAEHLDWRRASATRLRQFGFTESRF